MGCGGGCGGRERGQQPAEEQSARSARRRPLGEGGRKDGRTDGPTGRASASRRPLRLLTTSLPAVLAAPAASCCTGLRRALGTGQSPGARPQLGGSGCLLLPPASRGRDCCRPPFSPPRPPTPPPARPLPALPPRSAHAGGADPGSGALSSASGRWERRQRRASGPPGSVLLC